MSDVPYRMRIHSGDPAGGLLTIRDVLRLVLHLPLDHHELAGPVRRAMDLYLGAIEAPSKLLSEYDLGVEPCSLDEYGWERVYETLSPPSGVRFLDDVRDEREIHRYVKDQFERSVQLSPGPLGLNGYGFFYWARLPWRNRATVADQVSLVSFSWPTEVLETQGTRRIQTLLMELASLLPFSSGHAGLAFSSPHPFGISMEGIREEAFRHPGVDVAHGSTSLGPRIDGVHWLNFLGPPVLSELGGISELRARLQASGTFVLPLSAERAVVGLGPTPEAGDLTQGENLPAYREFSRLLRPWLYERPTHHVFEGATPDDTRQWERRFLDRHPGEQCSPLPEETD